MSLRLSIAIPTYGSPETVVKNVKEILKCRYTDIEVVIVDNDESGEQLKNVTEIITDQRFRYYRNSRNIGRNNNIARALEVSEANHVLILSSDDKLYLSALDEILETIDRNPACGVIMGTVNTSLGGTGFRPKKPGIYCQGYEALLNIPFLGNLVPMVINKTYVDFGKVYNQKEYYMHLRLALLAAGQGDFIYLKGPMGYMIAMEEINANMNIVEHVRSGVDLKKTWDVWAGGYVYCSGDARIVQLKQYIGIIESFNMRLNQKLKVIDVWTALFATIALEYAVACQSPVHISNYGFEGTYSYADILEKFEHEMEIFFSEREIEGKYFFNGRLRDIVKNEYLLLGQAEEILQEMEHEKCVAINNRDQRIAENLNKLLGLMDIRSVVLPLEANHNNMLVLEPGTYDGRIDEILKERGARKIYYMDRMAKYLGIVWCSRHQRPEDFAEYGLYMGR